VAPLRLLHAIHDFLPRYQAGSEIYALELGRELARRHHITILCADYDPSRAHADLVWRVHDGLPVVEIVNNWVCGSFEDTYRPPLIGDRLRHVLRAIQPDVVHVHNLLNLSFELPMLARAAGIPVVATLHDYTLVCPSGGQRIHRADRHVCHEIDVDRCARCFKESPFHTKMSLGVVAGAPAPLRSLAGSVRRHLPALADRLTAAAPRSAGWNIEAIDITRRLAAARDAWQQIDLFIAPSASIAREYERLGIAPSRIHVSDYGFPPVEPASDGRPAAPAAGRVRIGYVGTLVWHKGIHLLLDAVRALPASSYEVKIYGDPGVSEDYARELRTQAAGLPVTFLGPFDRGRAADVYRSIDVLVVPSLWLENSPLVIHEAYQARLPVIGARIGGIPELIDDGRNGLLFDAGSVGDLTRALRQVIDDPECLIEFSTKLSCVKSITEDALEWDARYADVLNNAEIRGQN
jgi:glycosyltransferase involved in cell wall biosynthesis